jgi:hypothetical protein
MMEYYVFIRTAVNNFLTIFVLTLAFFTQNHIQCEQISIMITATDPPSGTLNGCESAATHRTSISMPELMFRTADERRRKFGYSSFSDYLQHLVRQDIFASEQKEAA